MTLILILFVLASALVIAEVLFPSFGLLSLLAIACYVTAVMKGFDLGQTQGYGALSCVILGAPLTIWAGFQILYHTPFGSRLVLGGPKAEAVTGLGSDKSLATFMGKAGVAATDLRPSGAVNIAAERVDAVSDGDFIEEGTEIRVIYVEGNRLVVEAVTKTAIN